MNSDSDSEFTNSGSEASDLDIIEDLEYVKEQEEKNAKDLVETYGATNVISWGSNVASVLGGTDLDNKGFFHLPFPNFHGSQHVVSVATSSVHCAAITDSGLLFTWGSSEDGALGQGEVTRREEPSLVTMFVQNGDGLVLVKEVSCGSDFTGSHTAIVSRDGQLFTCGAGAALGLGHLQNRTVPKEVDFSHFDSRIDSVSCGGCFTVAVTKTGRLYSWGKHAGGRLGQGKLPETNKFGTKPGKSLFRTKRTFLFQTEPRPVYGFGDADDLKVNGIEPLPRMLGASCGHAFVIAWSEKELYVWGQNRSGQLGLGHLRDVLVPVKLDVKQPKVENENQKTEDEEVEEQSIQFQSACAGAEHGLAIDKSGHLWSWGGGGNCVLGRHAPDEAQWSIPGLVSFDEDRKIAEVCAGSGHSLCLTDGGQLFTWGYPNEEQQRKYSSLPPDVMLSFQFADEMHGESRNPKGGSHSATNPRSNISKSDNDDNNNSEFTARIMNSLGSNNSNNSSDEKKDVIEEGIEESKETNDDDDADDESESENTNDSTKSNKKTKKNKNSEEKKKEVEEKENPASESNNPKSDSKKESETQSADSTDGLDSLRKKSVEEQNEMSEEFVDNSTFSVTSQSFDMKSGIDADPTPVLMEGSVLNNGRALAAGGWHSMCISSVAHPVGVAIFQSFLQANRTPVRPDGEEASMFEKYVMSGAYDPRTCGTDVTLMLGTKSIRAHSFMLALRSEILQRRVLEGTRSNGTSMIILTEASSLEIANGLMEYIYTDSLDRFLSSQTDNNVAKSRIQQLLVTAEELNLARLAVMCKNALPLDMKTMQARLDSALLKNKNAMDMASESVDITGDPLPPSNFSLQLEYGVGLPMWATILFRPTASETTDPDSPAVDSIPVHDVVLRARSQWWRKFLEDNEDSFRLAYDAMEPLTIDLDEGFDCCLQFLRYIYSGRIAPPTVDTLYDQVKCARKYNCPRMVVLCEQLIEVDHFNVEAIYHLAKTLRLRMLTNRCLRFTCSTGSRYLEEIKTVIGEREREQIDSEVLQELTKESIQRKANLFNDAIRQFDERKALFDTILKKFHEELVEREEARKEEEDNKDDDENRGAFDFMFDRGNLIVTIPVLAVLFGIALFMWSYSSELMEYVPYINGGCLAIISILACYVMGRS
eukprot:TRINITY_DN2041_c0_g1_i1.p1 TRINITY_DN2041_c0_g1~~TRINITY_DN2041_c0_g1_i1.p1  ORF type:complete len:1158 (+),score=388.46 TRINITY_DN2041_c0_g1_i1:93-3566(+)